MITNLYIDGFNLYYRALKDTPFRWLDLRRLAETLFPQDSINRVSYFTARLDVRPGNPGQAQRQLIYLRALATLPRFDSYFGVFRSGVKRRPLAESVPGLPTHVLVRDSEEKGIGREPRHPPAWSMGSTGSTSRRSSCPMTRTLRGRCGT